jgi:hypothetical protein
MEKESSTLSQRELIIRRRTVKGWTFRGLPADEEAAIIAFLSGGLVPDGYQSRYELEQRLMK